MDKLKSIPMNMDNGNKRWTKEEPLENGKGTKRIEVEEVSNGFIKSVIIEGEMEGEYKYKCVKSIHEDNPLEETPLVEKLKRVIEGKS